MGEAEFNSTQVIYGTYVQNPQTLADGDISPLRVDQTGSLVVSAGSGGGGGGLVNQGSAGSTPWPVKVTDGSTSATFSAANAAADPTVATSLVVQQTDRVASGTITTTDFTSGSNAPTAGSSVAISCGGMGSIGVSVTGTGSGSLAGEAYDGVQWLSLGPGIPVVGGPSTATFSGSGNWRINSGDFQTYRVRATSLVSGSWTVNLHASQAIVGMHVATRGKYKLNRDTLSDGTSTDIQLGPTGEVLVAGIDRPASEYNSQGVTGTTEVLSAFQGAPFQPTLGTDFGAATKKSFKTTQGNLLSLSSYNKNAAARYILVHNKASAPVAGDSALISFYMPAGATFQTPRGMFPGMGLACSTGIATSISTTDSTFTDSATATDHNQVVLYA